MLGGAPDGSPLRLAPRAQLRDDPSGSPQSSQPQCQRPTGVQTSRRIGRLHGIQQLAHPGPHQRHRVLDRGGAQHGGGIDDLLDRPVEQPPLTGQLERALEHHPLFTAQQEPGAELDQAGRVKPPGGRAADPAPPSSADQTAAPPSPGGPTARPGTPAPTPWPTGSTRPRHDPSAPKRTPRNPRRARSARHARPTTHRSSPPPTTPPTTPQQKPPANALPPQPLQTPQNPRLARKSTDK